MFLVVHATECRHISLPELPLTACHLYWHVHPCASRLCSCRYRATGDPFYVEVGRVIMMALEDHTRVPCGFAAIKDVRGFVLEDQMDSFVLAETFKYL